MKKPLPATSRPRHNFVTRDTVIEYHARFLRYMAKKYGGETTLNELRVMNQILRCRFRVGFVCHLCELPCDSCGPTAISKMTGIPKSTVSRAVYNLVQAGWLREERHTDDGRRIIVQLGDATLARKDDWKLFVSWFDELSE